MSVSFRHAAIIGVMASCLLTSAAMGIAMGPPSSGKPKPDHGCCKHPSGSVIAPPQVFIGGSSVVMNQPSIHMGQIHSSSHLSVNVNVNAHANASSYAGGDTIIYGGGGYYPGSPVSKSLTALENLNLAREAEIETRYEDQVKTRWVEEWRLVRAVCMDDQNTPHPASRPDPQERVDTGYNGEVFRCMAGTYMHVTMGWRKNGKDIFDGGETLICKKSEALRHKHGGHLYCAKEEARRNCNERSLLRQYGPGLKLIYSRHEQTYTERVERTVSVERKQTSSMRLMLNGGVGGY